MQNATRRASHAGTWYQDDPQQLKVQFEQWMQVDRHSDLQQDAVIGLISPHAGYSYCGHVAVSGYRQLLSQFSAQTESKKLRIFILGPSHHLHMRRCALSRCQWLATPFGSLKVDQSVNMQLYESGGFQWLTQSQDEDEHSIEMQLPILAYYLKLNGYRLGECDHGDDVDVQVVPIMVGHLNSKQQYELFASKLQRYFQQMGSADGEWDAKLIVSSDFCHWGSRFGFTELPDPAPAADQIWQRIEHMDREAMAIIEQGDYTTALTRFMQYLERTGNTICGRNPICIMLALSDAVGGLKVNFVKYAQSSKCRDFSDSSVSYACACLRL